MISGSLRNENDNHRVKSYLLTQLHLHNYQMPLYLCVFNGEGGGRGVRDGVHVYTCGGLMLMYGKTNTIL